MGCMFCIFLVRVSFSFLFFFFLASYRFFKFVSRQNQTRHQFCNMKGGIFLAQVYSVLEDILGPVDAFIRQQQRDDRKKRQPKT